MITSPWPFAQWGLDIIGPFPRARGNRRFVLVPTDYFTKWVKAEALANIRDVDVKKFVWKNIVTRFEVPRILVSDKGLQFDNKEFRECCSDLGIINRYSSPAYPPSNRQAEATSKTIINGLKKRLEWAKGNLVEELPSVLWAYQTTPRRSIGETLFSLTYGVEAVILVEISPPSMRVTGFSPNSNDIRMVESLDPLEGRQGITSIRLTFTNRNWLEV